MKTYREDISDREGADDHGSLLDRVQRKVDRLSWESSPQDRHTSIASAHRTPRVGSIHPIVSDLTSTRMDRSLVSSCHPTDRSSKSFHHERE